MLNHNHSDGFPNLIVFLFLTNSGRNSQLKEKLKKKIGPYVNESKFAWYRAEFRIPN